MNVLVATRNRDKFDIVRRMVEGLIPDAHLVSLADAKLAGEVVEVGTIAQRAVQKARYFFERINVSGRANEFDAVLAIDDGLSIAGGEANPNSKELTDQVLEAKWPEGASVSVVRAFALIRRGEQPRVEITTVPFTFRGNTTGVKRSGGQYPLSRVLAPVGFSVPVSELTQDDENKFNLAHSSDALRRLFG